MFCTNFLNGSIIQNWSIFTNLGTMYEKLEVEKSIGKGQIEVMCGVCSVSLSSINQL